ncbi:MAG: hypothetical protein U5N58_05190 [Actinomycetota bacterium]|nr:hypothetical protein [Actinomycetota bacterium]
METGLNLYPHIQNLPLGILKQGRLNHHNLSFARQLQAIENLPPLHYDRIIMGMEGRKEQIENLNRVIFNRIRCKDSGTKKILTKSAFDFTIEIDTIYN